ncbi:MAG: ribosomal protein S18-alanine N-acetyltransferase [Acidobacteriaceae bacterium]|nr:ribosomal protein S18-alanine N-acetyltransferase [Acidobacteriaceae bacterium]
MHDVVVRRATLLDLETLWKISESEAQAPHWSRSSWEQTLGSPQRLSLLAESEGRVAGVLVVACVGSIAEVETVVVVQQARRKGVALRLLIQAQDELRARGVRELELEVRASNSAALGLYAHLGFLEQGRRARYYSAPEEDALLLAKSL